MTFGKLKQRHNPGKILVVEDDPVVSEVVATWLTTDCMDVVRARDGNEALEYFKDNPHAVRLVIVDFSIPGMHASQLVMRLRRIDRNLRIILSSGFSEKDVFGELSPSLIDQFIAKPFDRYQIEKAVFGLLHEA